VAVASGAAIYLAPSPTTVSLAVGAVLGAMGGLLVTPDIDQIDITHEERRLIRLNPAEHLEYEWLPAHRAAARATSWTNRDAIRRLSGLGW
jgi:RES domain-containing protein